MAAHGQLQRTSEPKLGFPSSVARWVIGSSGSIWMTEINPQCGCMSTHHDPKNTLVTHSMVAIVAAALNTLGPTEPSRGNTQMTTWLCAE